MLFRLQVAHFKDYIPKAFPGGHSMILDSEVLLIDNNTGKPLPFGTLGVHKVLAQDPMCRLCVCTWACCHSEKGIGHFGWSLVLVFELFLNLALHLDSFYWKGPNSQLGWFPLSTIETLG